MNRRDNQIFIIIAQFRLLFCLKNEMCAVLVPKHKAAANYTDDQTSVLEHLIRTWANILSFQKAAFHVIISKSHLV